ncbi:MAG: hypothetical protein ACKVQU_34350 [Burkholderiales bacterium]
MTAPRRAAALLAWSACAMNAICAAQPVDRKFDPALYRAVTIAEATRAPIGAPIASSPMVGLREDQVRAKAQFTGGSRERTSEDARLLDAWMLAKRFAKADEKTRWLEAEVTDGKQRVWLPVFPLALMAVLQARAGDEFELYIHRFDAPHAGVDLAGSVSLVMGLIPTKAGSTAALGQPIFHDGGLLFKYRGAQLGIGVNAGGQSSVTSGANPEQAAGFVLDFANSDGSKARLEVAGLQGPGSYVPKIFTIALPPGGSLGDVHVVDVRGCRAPVRRANNFEIEGVIECPAGERSPSDARFSVRAR